MLQIVEEKIRRRGIENWDSERMKKVLSTMWENGYFLIGDKRVRMKDSLSIGSCIISVMAGLGNE